MSRSMMPLQRWNALGRCPLAHSVSSRTSIRSNLSPRSNRCLIASTVVSRTRCLLSLTSCRKRGECCLAITPPSRRLDGGWTWESLLALNELNVPDAILGEMVPQAALHLTALAHYFPFD